MFEKADVKLKNIEMKPFRMQFLYVPFLFSLIVLSACANSQNAGSKEYSCCEVYKKVVCSNDTSVSYSLRLPEGFDTEKQYPLLLLFDPHGDGLFALTKFSKSAANTGFIIAGSNNSKNGMSFDVTNAIFNSMLLDLNSRFKINKKAIYLCGFSGGARVSIAVAFTQPGIAGVVACGAGLPNVNRTVSTPFSLLTVAGERDFNFTEIKQLDAMLESGGFTHHFLEFDGKHEWPPETVVDDIFLWLQFDAMRSGAVPVNRLIINNFIESADRLANKGDEYVKYTEYVKMKHYLQKLSDISPLQIEIDKLLTDKNLLNRQKLENEIYELEKSLQQKYSADLETQNLAWWTSEATKLHKKVAANSALMSTMYSRLLGYLSLNCYMLSHNALKQNYTEAAVRFTEIYRLVDPENAEHRYIAAIISAKSKNTENICRYLNEALILGFSDINRIRSEAALAPYLNTECVKQVLAGIEAKTK